MNVLLNCRFPYKKVDCIHNFERERDREKPVTLDDVIKKNLKYNQIPIIYSSEIFEYLAKLS